MRFVHRFAIRHPVPVFALAAIAILSAAPGLLKLRLRTDGYALVPAGRPEVAFDRVVRDEFDAEDLVVVLVRSRHPDGIFNPDTLRLIQRLTHRFQALEGVQEHNVSSLETEHSHRVRPGTLDFRRFLETLPETPEALATLRADLERIRLHTGTFLSSDGSAASILVGVPPGADRTALYGRIRTIIADEGGLPEEVCVIGAPVAEALLGLHILEDLGVPRSLLGIAARAEADGGGWRLPHSLYELRRFVGRHIGLVPMAILVMLLVFVVCFRSVAAASLPLVEVGACLVTVFGLMGWLGVPIYLTIAVMPVILTAMGVADEIHIFDRYVQLLRADRGGAYRTVLTAAMDEMWVPVAKTSLTTAVGFLSFALSPLGPVRAFGIFTSVGIIFCMLWSLTVVPAMLSVARPAWFVGRDSRAAGGQRRVARLLAALAALACRRRGVLLAVGLLVVLAAPLGLRRVVVQDSWIEGFARDSEFYRATQVFNELFLGTHILLVRVVADAPTIECELGATALGHHALTLPADRVSDSEGLVGCVLRIRRFQAAATDPNAREFIRRVDEWRARIESVERGADGLVVRHERRRGSPVIAMQPRSDERFAVQIVAEPFTQPELVKQVGALEEFIAGQRDRTVGGVIGTAALLSTTNLMARGLREEARRVPDSADRIEWLWGQYGRIRGGERLRQAVSEDYAHGLVTVFLKNANFVDVQALMDAIRGYERERLKPHGISLGFAGDVAVSQTLIRAIVQTQVWSLVLSLGGILALTTIMARSLHWGVYAVLPCALAVLVNFALMGWGGMPLGVATSMFAGMTLGIGVDFSIHLLERYRLAIAAGRSRDDALVEAVAVSGPAIVIDAAGIALGFGILVLSQVPANARLGALVVLSIVNCLVATLILLPALLSAWPPRQRAPGNAERAS